MEMGIGVPRLHDHGYRLGGGGLVTLRERETWEWEGVSPPGDVMPLV
jgi:hypothetical protein